MEMPSLFLACVSQYHVPQPCCYTLYHCKLARVTLSGESRVNANSQLQMCTHISWCTYLCRALHHRGQPAGGPDGFWFVGQLCPLGDLLEPCALWRGPLSWVKLPMAGFGWWCPQCRARMNRAWADVQLFLYS